MTYQQALNYLLELPLFQTQGSKALKFGLDNIIELCNYLKNPQNNFRSIHVGGTNGKGSSSHLLAAVLQFAGYKVGLYTSPYLKNHTEQIRINGINISEKWIIDFVQKHKKTLKKISPSFFEANVAMAFQYFSEQKVDIAIIEVGMGGRLDSTNIINPIISLITNISYDHQQFLGDTLSKIAFEKAGIIKKNTTAIISEKQLEIEHIFKEKARQENANIVFAEDNFKIVQKKEGIVDIFFKNEIFLENIAPQLKGIYQYKNFLGVLAVIQHIQDFKIKKEYIRNAFENVCNITNFKGRWQKLQEEPLIVCDTGHNEAGIREVCEQIKRQNFEKLYIILGITADKNIDKILDFFPKNAIYFFCQANSMRAMPAEKLAELAQEKQLFGKIIPNVNQAIREAKHLANSQDFIFIGGSSFVVAEIEDL